MLLFQDIRQKEASAKLSIQVGFIVLLLLSTTSTSIFAEEITTTDTTKEQSEDQFHYQASFFTQYTPQNALEMVERLPGFNLELGDNNRGFGGNAGNVLIDGARPTSKSGGLRGALARIPTAQVEYIEILRGGVGSGETSGQSVIANVVRKKKGTSGRWALKFRRSPSGRILPNLEAAINTNLAEWKTAFDIDTGGFPGLRTALIEDRDANQVLTSSADEVFKSTMRWLFMNAEGATNIANGLLTLNGRLGAARRNFNTNRDIFTSRLPDGSDPNQLLDIDQGNKTKTAEFGVDWVSTTNDWKLHAIGIGLVDDNQFNSQLRFEDLSDPSTASSLFSQDSLKTEFIARTTYGFVGSDPFKPEYGIEIAQNRLTSDSNLIDDDSTVVLEGADVTVEEIRSEVFSTFTYQASPKLSLEGGLTGEISRITVSGDTGNQQTFKFLKPRISATYKLDKEHQLSAIAERNVGQLNFRDFAASNNAADDNTFSGNPDLGPDISDGLSATYDWSFNKRGSLKVKIFHNWKKDILEQIILPSGGQGLGNAGSARFWGIQTDLNLPLDWILENGLLEVSHGYQDASFDDPITSSNRVISNFSPSRLNIKLRQDVIDSQFAWGLEYFRKFTNINFNVNERITLSGNDRFAAFTETSRFLGIKIRLDVNVINTGDFTRSRFIHGEDRSTPLERTEVSFRHRKPEFKLSISGTF